MSDRIDKSLGRRQLTLLNQIRPELQGYNLDVLIAFVSVKRQQGCSPEAIKEELMRYNWDHLLVKLAVEKVFKK